MTASATCPFFQPRWISLHYYKIKIFDNFQHICVTVLVDLQCFIVGYNFVVWENCKNMPNIQIFFLFCLIDIHVEQQNSNMSINFVFNKKHEYSKKKDERCLAHLGHLHRWVYQCSFILWTPYCQEQEGLVVLNFIEFCVSSKFDWPWHSF